MRRPSLNELPNPPQDKMGWPWTGFAPQLSSEIGSREFRPQISIVTPSYNQAGFIEQTIRSVLLQGYPNIEYSVIDGGSTDGTIEIIKKYEPWLTYWVSKSDKGQSHAINRGLARAQGQVLGWLNSDDFFLPEAINHIVNLYRKKPEAVAWVGGCYRIDTQRRILSTVMAKGLERDSLADWAVSGHFYQPSCFFQAEAWNQVGPLDEQLHFAFDFDLYLKLANIGEFAATDQILSAATIHKDAKTQAQRARMRAEIFSIQVNHGYRELAINRLVNLLERKSLKYQTTRLARSGLERLVQIISLRGFKVRRLDSMCTCLAPEEDRVSKSP